MQKNAALIANSKLKRKWVLQIAEGLRELHSRQIMHTNLKPSNIYVDEFYNLQLGDYSFNATKSRQPGSGSESDAARFRYLCPEFLLGEELGLSGTFRH